MEKQELSVNCAVCDARKVTEETLSSYASVSINTGVLLSNARSRLLLGRYSVNVNSATVIDWEQEEAPAFSTYNGSYEIKAGTLPARPTILIVNGKLSISPDAASSLSSYLKIVVNGTIYCPESLSSSLGNVEINGKLIAYPDKAILTKSVFLPNRYFHRTAKEGSLYYTPKLLVLLDSQLDLPALVEKQVRFSAQKVVLHDKDLETVLELLENPDTADLAILPDNGTYMEDDAVLNDAFLQKYGPSFYINGNLSLNQASTPLISRLKNPHIDGTVLLSADQEAAFLATDPVYKELKVLRGQILTDRISVTIDRNLLSLSVRTASVSNWIRRSLRRKSILSCTSPTASTSAVPKSRKALSSP